MMVLWVKGLTAWLQVKNRNVMIPITAKAAAISAQEVPMFIASAPLLLHKASTFPLPLPRLGQSAQRREKVLRLRRLGLLCLWSYRGAIAQGARAAPSPAKASAIPRLRPRPAPAIRATLRVTFIGVLPVSGPAS